MDVSLRRHYVDQFWLRCFRNLPPGIRVADLGGHRDAKRGDFDIRSYNVDVVCVNLSAQHGADVIADAAHLPFEDASFDVVVCSELMEHVRSPPDVIREAWRILKPGGWFLACSPFLFHIHADPHDYGRYTDYFWMSVLRDQGFEQIAIEAQGGFWSVVVDMFRHVLNRESHRSRSRYWLVPFSRWAVRSGLRWAKWAALRWDAETSARAGFGAGFATGFGMTARRPEMPLGRTTPARTRPD